ncbi:hypothetical protein PILCRDRAFT_10521 [Piloderma croceum F 1598]|uniref:Uncharacterized protein n=1 Tax=Piloderma croceum (strain F 1598) TaxID=765440 RepID=A0A0C3F3P3_PILCF|nr:hypothetical protein PILCRDRAFT_10521 [Piloderma croceum F 1598]
MDTFYDFEGAKNSLHAYIQNRYENDTYQLSNFKDINTLKPVLSEKPTYWRLTIPAADKTETEELVLSMQGVIVNKDLPPILKTPNGQCQPVLRQTVELSGLDCDKFKTCVDTLRDLHQIFVRLVPEGDMEPLAFSQFHGLDTVEFSTRYFTSRHDDPNGTAIPFN